MIRIVLSLVLGALAAAPAVALPRTIYVMRHLERDAGRDPQLNAIGAANAERLASWFRRDPPRIIYVTPFKRAQQTAAPLATRLKATPISYDPTAPDAMLAAVQAAKGSVLIVGHSNTVPKIVAALGGPVATADLDDTDYGRIWLIRHGRVIVASLALPQP